MSPAARLFKRALAEKLAFTPMGPDGPQAAGPGGAPAGGPPGAGGPPPGAPMDPSAGGAPPGGPGGPPPDAGAPPPPPGGDPGAGGAPMDPGAGMPPPGMDPMAGMPPPEAPPKDPIDEQAKAKQELGTDDAMVPLSQLKDFTVGVIEATKGKKTLDAVQPEPKADKPDPSQAPGPVTGLPGFDPSALGGPLKTGSVLTRTLFKTR